MTLNNHNNNQLPCQEKKIIKLPRFESPGDGKQSRKEQKRGRQRSEQICEPVFVVEEKEGSKDIAERDILHISLVKRPAPLSLNKKFHFLPKSNLIVARAGGADQNDDLGKYDRSGSG